MSNNTNSTNHQANSNEYNDGGDPLSGGFGGLGIRDTNDLGSSPQDIETLSALARNMYLPQYNPNFMDRFGGFNFNLPPVQPTSSPIYSSPPQAQGLRYPSNLPQTQTAQSLGSQYPISPLIGNQYLAQPYLTPQQLLPPQLTPQLFAQQQQQQQLLTQQLLAHQLLSQPLLTQQQQLLALQLGLTPQQFLNNQYMILQQQQQAQQSSQSPPIQPKSPPMGIPNPIQSQLQQQQQFQLQLQQLQLNNSLLNHQPQLQSPAQVSNPLLTQQLYLQQQYLQQQLHQQQLQLQQQHLQQQQAQQTQQTQQTQQIQPTQQTQQTPVQQPQQSPRITQANSPQLPSPRSHQSSPRIQQAQQPQKSNSPLLQTQKSQSPLEQEQDHSQHKEIESDDETQIDLTAALPPSPVLSLSKSQEISNSPVPQSQPQQSPKPTIPLPIPLPTPTHAKLAVNGISPKEKLKDPAVDVPNPPKKETAPVPAPKVDAKPPAKPAWEKNLSGEMNGKETDEEQPSRVLWVGNIGTDVTEKELADEFEPFGPLESIRILHDRFCAFVNFIIEEDAVAAKQAMQGQIVGSQYIVVNFRQTKAEDSYVPPEPAPAVQPSRALYIGNLSELVGEKELRKECEKFGEIESIFVKRNKNCAFINFVTVKAATAALTALQNKKLGDTNIKVNYGKSSPSSKDQKETPPTTVPKLRSSGQGQISSAHKPAVGPPYMQSTQPPTVSPPQLPVNAWSAPPLIKNQNRKVASPAPAPANWTAPAPAVKDTNPLTVSQEIGARDWMAENGLDICEVCFNSFRTTLFVPCHHTCCNECMTKLRTSSIYRADKGSKCPFCQEVIKQYVSISTFNKQNKT